MNKKNFAIGLGLIFLGLLAYLKNFNIRASDLATLFLGVILLYLYAERKDQPFLIFGSIFSVLGLFRILNRLAFIRFHMGIEIWLILTGIGFMYGFLKKGNPGLIIPGAILPALGLNTLIMRYGDTGKLWPMQFLLLGIAFYAIYFVAYRGRERWPLIPGTILILVSLFFFSLSLNLVTIDSIYYNKIAWPVVMISAGVLLLYSAVKGKRRN